ncbi:MAG: CHAD domain-containing protein [Acidobacteriaceae bacterium]|nr:CHAD domain-containing protein [Acidobacteriaceae bacterium]
MPYRFKAGESVPENIKRIATEEIDSAIDQLQHGTGKKRDEAIHEARKSIKKLRGVLKLIRPELDAAYRTENAALRELGGRLSELRDAGAIIETFDSIVGKHRGKLTADGLAPIRKGLRLRKQQKEKALNVTRVVNEAISGLGTARQRVLKWQLDNDGFESIASGLKRTYRDGKIAMRVALKTARPEDYHEWRKRAKDHWYHIRLLESLWTEMMEARENSLHDLETWLGDDHNLVVLCEQLEQDSDGFGGQDTVQLFSALARQEQGELRKKSESLGQRVYEEKPKEFVRNVSKLWDVWHEHPRALKDVGPTRRGPQSAAPSVSRKAAHR